MGLTAAATLGQKLIFNFKPKYLVMTGIAAGIKGKGNFGDIIFSELVWDYGSGKITTEKNGALGFQQDPRPLTIAPEIKAHLQKEFIQDNIVKSVESSWQKGNGEMAKTRLKVILGPMASGSYVIENIKKIQEVVDQQRKLVGIDMEAYAIFYAATYSTNPKPIPIVIKSICDFGDSRKNNKMQAYASYTSANFLYHFALKYL